MKQTDNRQKQQIQLRAQKNFKSKNSLRGQGSENSTAPDEKTSDENSQQAAPVPIHRSEPKIGRNDPCPCGSGKKYKKCCLAAA